MSIAPAKTTRPLSQTLPASEMTSALRLAFARLRSPLWLCLLLALITRVWLIYHAQGLMDGDEAQLGVQALRILQGEHPAYFYGQPYMGSLAAHLLAPLLGLVGPEAWALRAEPLCFSLLLVYLTWLLAGALADSTQLATAVRRRFQTIATLVAALPPLYDGVVEMRVWGGYIETFVFSLWLLYSVVRLSQYWLRGIGLGESLLRWAGIGLLVGIGLWVDPLIELPLLICILWLVGASLGAFFREGGARPVGANLGARFVAWLPATARVARGQAPRLHIFKRRTRRCVDDGFTLSSGIRHAGSHRTSRAFKFALMGASPPLQQGSSGAGTAKRQLVSYALGRNWLASIAAVPAALLGFMPGLCWGYSHQWENVQYILHPGRNVIAYDPYIAAAYPTRLDKIRGVTENYLTCDLPRVFSGLTPNVPQQRTSALAQLLHPQTLVRLGYNLTLTIMLLCVVGAIALFLLSHIFKHIGFMRKLFTLPLLFITVVSGALCLSDLTAHYLVHHTCDADKTGRYASLLILVLPLLVAAVLTIMGTRRGSALCQPSPTGTMFPLVYRVDGPHGRPQGYAPTSIVVKGILLLALVLYLSAQGMAYTQVASDSYFRSPPCKIALTHTDQALDYLQKQHIRYLWSEIWIGNVLMFKSATNVISTDPRVFTSQLKDRIPDYSNAIRSTQHASVAFFASQGDNLSERLKMLDDAHVKYQTARFTIDRGVDLIIVTPVDYRLQPSEATALVMGGPGC